MKNILILVVVIGFVVISNSVFIVDEREHALKFRFGEVIKSDYEPGIHFKVPFAVSYTHLTLPTKRIV